MVKFVPKEIKVNYNVTHVHPLKNFFYLISTVVVFSVVIYLSLGLLANILVVRMPANIEQKIGAAIVKTMPTSKVSGRQLAYLKGLIYSLKDPQEEFRLPITIHLWNTNAINAGVLPGGQMLITKGLLEFVESENELAFVLGHEIGHFQNKHSLKALGRSLVLLAAFTLVGFGGEGSGSQLVVLTTQLTELHYRREQEIAADRYALIAMQRKYGHVAKSSTFFERINKEFLHKKESKEIPFSKYFKSHPLTDERIQKINKMAKQNGWSMRGVVYPAIKY